MSKDCLKGCPKGTKLRSSEHPGFVYQGKMMNTFANKHCVVSKDGAFFGHIPRYVKFDDASNVSCITVFGSQGESRAFAERQMEIANAN